MGLKKYTALDGIMRDQSEGFAEVDGWEFYSVADVDPLLTPSPGAGLPEGVPTMVAWSKFRGIHRADEHGALSCHAIGCTPLEIHPIGFGAELAALRAPTERGAEAPCAFCSHWPHPDAPHEWNADTIKDAPEGFYQILKVSGEWSEYKKTKATVIEDWEEFPRNNNRAFGPIPQPETST